MIDMTPAVPLPDCAGPPVRAADAAPDDAAPEQVRCAFDYMPAILYGNLAGIAVVTLLYQEAAGLRLALWLLPASAVLATRSWLYRSFLGAEPGGLGEWQRWRRWWNSTTLASAAMWGWSAWLLYPLGDPVQQTALIVVVYSFCVAVMPVLATQPRVYLAYGALCFVPMVLRIALAGDPHGLRLAGILLLIFSMTMLLSRNYRQALQRAIDSKRDAEHLLAELRDEKQVADDARRVAEVASRAKTQFFAAASHDLRQPLHAMGLFAEALRSKVYDQEVTKLVNSINESVDALETLFSELLDITRIDAGGVRVDAQSFEIEQVLRRLKLHFEPAAFEKGLALRMRGGSRIVHADPVLVERIMRNLLANAIRYTRDGGVLVGARQRRGEVVLQVWDTGPGIAEADQERIFDEFYQVGACASLIDVDEGGGHQRKGLGLGLAIVRRLADLMKVRVDLVSRPGRGTVFSMTLPAGRMAAGIATSAPPRPIPNVTLQGRHIVLVEDDPAVRNGLEVLLGDWQARVDSFDSVSAALAWADSALARADEPPALLIVDYRIQEGHTGVEAIAGLRRRFGHAIPAIVVTGSTMSGIEHDAERHDFHLLIKPVAPNKLRAMIGFKLGVKAA